MSGDTTGDTGGSWDGAVGGSEAFDRHVAEGCRRAEVLADRIGAGELQSVLPEIRSAWVETELPSRCLEAWASIWSAVASLDAPSRVMSWWERLRYRVLPSEVTVYRGAAPGGERGWSWTLNRTIAEDFARRYVDGDDGAQQSRLCRTTVDKSRIVAYFRFGGEDEVILDPRRIDWSAVVVGTLAHQDTDRA